MQKKYAHLSDIIITDHDTKKDLPVHGILGAGDYTKIKTQERTRVGQPGEPIAEVTRLGWVVISPSQESGLTNMMLSKTSLHDYKNLCSLDVLGVKEKHVRREEVVYDEFKKQLSQSLEELRFHWVDSLESKTIQILRFARLVFGLTQSSFILEGTLKKHFQNYRESFKELIKIIETDMYVDDLVTGGNNLEEVKEIKQNSVQLFKKGGFNLHKWNSNVPAELESENSNQSELTYAKQVLNQGRNETKILGLEWNKRNDTLSVVTLTFKKNHHLTKRNILSELASVYELTGLISPAHLMGKILYREICESRISWDESVPQTIKLKWGKWKIDVANKVEILRSLTLKLELITSVDLHIFGDASTLGYCAVAYAVVSQPSKVNQVEIIKERHHDT